MKTYSKKEIAFILQTTERIIFDDIKYLKIKPIDYADYGQKLYNDRAFELVKQLREHCREEGKTRETFIVPTSVEVVDAPLAPHGGIERETQKDAICNFIEIAKQQDPLYDLELLQRVSDRNWLLPTFKLAAIIGLKPDTLAKKPMINYCGFICSRHLRFGKTYLWKIHLLGES